MSASIPRDLIEVHRRYNRNSADLWDPFGSHRDRVTRLALDAGGETLLVMGAGNCNDLDLDALSERPTAIHLADLDAEALQRARVRLPARVTDKLHLHAPVDLSGALADLKTFARQPPTRAQLREFPTRCAEGVVAALPGPVDTILSAALLSQIMHGCRVALGPHHPHLPVLARALAAAHLRAMVGLLRPGGTAILVTDTATSENSDLRARWAGTAPLPLLEALQREDALLTGTDPALLLDLLTSDPAVAPLVGKADLTAPWLWTLGPNSLLVYALIFRRRP
jgi:hypothetical protein